MARPKKPSNILKLKGAFKKNPNRENTDEPEVAAAFPSKPPCHLNKDEIEVWNEIVSIAPAGVLTGADVITVEMIACLLVEYRRDREEFPPAKLTRLSGELKSIGLNPSGRAGLHVVKKPVNEFL